MPLSRIELHLASIDNSRMNLLFPSDAHTGPFEHENFQDQPLDHKTALLPMLKLLNMLLFSHKILMIFIHHDLAVDDDLELFDPPLRVDDLDGRPVVLHFLRADYELLVHEEDLSFALFGF